MSHDDSPFEFALTLPPKRTIAVLEKRAQVFLKRKEHEEVVRTSEKLRPLAADAPNAIYNIACFYSLCSNLVSEDPLPLTQQQQKLREQYQLKAVESLKQAISAGFEDFKLMQKDSDLDALRQRDDFKKLIEKRPEPGKNSPEPDNKTPASSAGG